MKRLLLILATLSALSLTACNTVEGFGKDLKKAGERIEGHAENASK